MKKVSLLAASVAIGLVGCGGDNSVSSAPKNDDPNSNSITITGFDGYFKNAVVFDDENNNGVLDPTENIFGLTNERGEYTLPHNAQVRGSLALKTITPGAMDRKTAEKIFAQPTNDKKLSDLLDTYTTDMDLPGQPMANIVVLRTPTIGDDNEVVISPITDLVAIKMKDGTPLDVATAAVNTALGGTSEEPIDLFSNFIKDSKTNLESARLHKTAQILTESKAQNPGEYEKQAEVIAGTAAEKSEEIVNEDNMDDKDLVNDKPIINPEKPEEAIRNYKLIVNSEARSEIKAQVGQLEIIKGTSFYETISVPENLFEDKYAIDGEMVPVKPSVDINGNGEITVNLNEAGTELTLSADNLDDPQHRYTITFSAEDKATANSEDVLNTLSTTFTIDVDLTNAAPSVVTEEQARIQVSIVGTWTLEQGKSFSAQIPVEALFFDREGNELSYTTNIDRAIPGLKSNYNSDLGIIEIDGYPHKANSVNKQFSIYADDGLTATFLASEPATFTLPIIAPGDITIDSAVASQLQSQITDSWSLTVGEGFEQVLDISDLFVSDIAGEIKYYAHYAANDNEPASNPIPGVRVNVDDSGQVRLSGTPNDETSNVILYVAQGINFSGGEESDIESETVMLNLPDVQPGTITPPPATLEDKFFYQAVVESYQGQGTGLRCEVRYFDSSTSHLYAYSQTLNAFSTCPKINEDDSPSKNNNFESLGAYSIDADGRYVIHVNDDDGSFTISYGAQAYEDYFVFQNTETWNDDSAQASTFDQIYAAYTNPQPVNDLMSQQITDGVENDKWAESSTHYVNSDGSIDHMDVKGAMNDVDENCSGDMCESDTSDADIYIKMSCDEVRNTYEFEVYTISGIPFNWDVQYFPADGNSCGIDFSSVTPISSGIRTLHGRVKEEHSGKFEDILFSFER